MPVRLQLEGQDLESLLERVQDEYGARARIVEAEKLRTGGVGGFFAKETFAMTVELDEDGEPQVPDDASSLMDLVDAASRHEVSTSSEAFSDVMSRISRSSGGSPYDEFVAAAPPPAVPARRARPARPPLRSATGEARSDDVVDEALVPALDDAAEHAIQAAVRAAAQDVVDAEAAAVADTTPAPVVPAQRRRVASTAPTAPTAQVAPKPRGKAKAKRTPAAPRRAAAPTTPARRTTAAARPVAAPARTPKAPSTAARLRALGLPEALVPARPADLHRSLVRALEALPVAAEPALHPGGVLMVVGTAGAALEAARRLSVELDLDPGAVALCAPVTSLGLVPAKARIDGPLRLAALVETAARRSRPLVLAVDERVATPATGARHGWPTGVIGLCPGGTRWGVTSAMTKTSDVDRWVERVGGVDALWVEDVELSGDPATVLAAAVPAARIDGRRATPAAWASLLCERLA